MTFKALIRYNSNYPEEQILNPHLFLTKCLKTICCGVFFYMYKKQYLRRKSKSIHQFVLMFRVLGTARGVWLPRAPFPARCTSSTIIGARHKSEGGYLGLFSSFCGTLYTVTDWSLHFSASGSWEASLFPNVAWKVIYNFIHTTPSFQSSG